MGQVENLKLEGISGRKGKRAIFQQIAKKLGMLPGAQLVLSARRRVSAVAETPKQVSFRLMPAPRPAEACRGLTVISTNLWHDWPQRRRAVERLEAFAELVDTHEADVLLLQEVARTTGFWTDQWLANRLGMGYVYSRANGHLEGIGFEEGLAIFSRHRIDAPILRQLNSRSYGFVHRMALGAQIASPCGDLLAFSVHLGLAGKPNARQAAHLSNWVRERSERGTALVGGDFNASEGSRQIKSLQRDWLDTFRHMHPNADGTTHELRWPGGRSLHRARLDYIFLKAEEARWSILEARHLETPGERHSDHRAVLLRLTPTQTER